MVDRVIVLEYGEGPEVAEVATVAELDAIFDAATKAALAEDCPIAVTMYVKEEGPDGPGLLLGLGRDWSVLISGSSHVPGSLDGGQPSAWFYGNQWSYAGPGHGVPLEAAREAAREFVRTGERPTNLVWVDDA